MSQIAEETMQKFTTVHNYVAATARPCWLATPPSHLRSGFTLPGNSDANSFHHCCQLFQSPFAPVELQRLRRVPDTQPSKRNYKLFQSKFYTARLARSKNPSPVSSNDLHLPCK